MFFIAQTMVGVPARADSIYTVSLYTSQLPAQTYDLYFSLLDGSGTGDGNNTVTVSDFSCYDCPNSPVVLTDNQFFQDSTNPVTPGSLLTFHLDTTENLDSGGIPDTFEWKFLDPNAVGGPAPIATDDPITGEDLLAFDVTGPWPAVLTYASTDTNFPFPAAEVTASAGAPEPSGALLVATALAFLAAIGCLRARCASRDPIEI